MKCCFCKKAFIGHGNNPAPLEDSKKRCCDECNYKIVIPARASEYYTESNK